MRLEAIEDLGRILKNYPSYEIHFCINVFGDPVRVIYQNEFIVVRVCDRFKYLEILNLTNPEKRYLLTGSTRPTYLQRNLY